MPGTSPSPPQVLPAGHEARARRWAGLPRDLPLSLPSVRYGPPPPELSHAWSEPRRGWPLFITPIQAGNGKGPITVVIHGAGYSSTREANRLADQLAALSWTGETHLLHWPSPSVGINAGAAFLGGLFRSSGSARDHATRAGIDTAETGAKLAERLADSLGTALASLGPSPERPIRLVGHSLGAHFALSALGTPSLAGVPIEEVVLLAGCTSATVDGAKLREQGVGRVINVYSSNDDAITTMSRVRGPQAGSHPIQFLGAPVALLNLSTQLRHEQYWGSLPAIDAQVQALGAE